MSLCTWCTATRQQTSLPDSQLYVVQRLKLRALEWGTARLRPWLSHVRAVMALSGSFNSRHPVSLPGGHRTHPTWLLWGWNEMLSVKSWAGGSPVPQISADFMGSGSWVVRLLLNFSVRLDHVGSWLPCSSAPCHQSPDSDLEICISNRHLGVILMQGVFGPPLEKHCLRESSLFPDFQWWTN